MDARRRSMIIGDLAVLLVAFIWGATNVVIRDALDGITPFWFCFLRFVVASAALMLLFGRRAFAMTRRAKVRGMLTGVVFSLAYLSGAVGLLYTTAGNQSFIVSMSGNKFILMVYKSLYKTLMDTMDMAAWNMYDPKNISVLLDPHRMIIDAMENRDIEGCFQAKFVHIDVATKTGKDSIR